MFFPLTEVYLHYWIDVRRHLLSYMDSAPRKEFQAALARLSSVGQGALIMDASIRFVSAVMGTAIMDSRANQSGNADITAAVQTLVSDLCIALNAACDHALHEKAVSIFCVLDQALRSVDERYVTSSKNNNVSLAPISDADAAALASVAQEVVRAEICRILPAAVARLRDCEGMPAPLSAKIESILKLWKREKRIPSEMISALSMKRKESGITAPEAPPQPPIETIDLVTETPTVLLPRSVVEARAHLVKNALDVLCMLPPSSSARLWALMPSESTLRAIAVSATGPETDEAISTLTSILSEARAELERTRQALAPQSKSHAGGSGADPVNSYAITLAPALECDIRRAEVPRSSVMPPIGAPYSPYQTTIAAPHGHVARRLPGISTAVWVETKDLGKLPVVEYAPVDRVTRAMEAYVF